MALTPRGELAHELETLRQDAGQPSLRDIAGRSACSHTTVSKLLAPDQPLPSWKHVEAITRYLEGNVEQIRLLWLAAQPQPTIVPSAGRAVEAGYRRTSSGSRYYLELGVLLLLLLGCLMFGTLASPEAQWVIAVAAQALLFTAGSVWMLTARRRTDDEARRMFGWLAAAGGLCALVEFVQLGLLLAPSLDHAVVIGGGLVYLVARVMLVMAAYSYLRRRSRSALGPWVRAAINWTPLLWLVSFAICFGLERLRPRPIETPFVTQVVLDATYFTLDVEFGVLCLVVLLRYTNRRQPFFLMLLLAGTMWLSDLVWNLHGPEVEGVPFGVEMGYIVAGAAYVAISRHPELRRAERPAVVPPAAAPAPDTPVEPPVAGPPPRNGQISRHVPPGSGRG